MSAVGGAAAAVLLLLLLPSPAVGVEACTASIAGMPQQVSRLHDPHVDRGVGKVQVRVGDEEPPAVSS